ncbi:putative minus-end-directed kinesin ATPase [Lupinus albus]|uniref:Putative minus-end-directed kinesin ATPase n=1 Tax=Lupinus albus TaxID=3870 RepID=A0A6A4QM39_LUPAL|nr:putative minus-end-directed kinesin ATPase [Lupinus albus]
MDNLNGFPRGSVFEDSQLASLVNWINAVLPNFNLPLETSEEELRSWLRDGSVLCSILDKLVPGSVERGNGSLEELVGVKRFLVALDDLALPGFELSDLEQGSMLPVLHCLETLKTHFACNVARGNIQSSRKRWDRSDLTPLEETDSCLKDASKIQRAVDSSVVSDEVASLDGLKSNEMSQLKRGSHVDLSDAKLMELVKSNSLDTTSTELLFNIGNRILGDIFERKNGDVPHAQRAVCLLRKILQVIELRFSNQAEGMKNQNNLFKAREGKYQSRMNALETLAAGTTEENEVVTGWVQQLKFTLQLEQNKFEEKKKLEDQDFSRLKKEKIRNEIEISALKQELEMARGTHEEQVLQLELQANESKAEYEKKIQELERHLANTRKRVKDLEASSESRYLKWKNKEHTYQSFLNSQHRAIQKLKAGMKSIKNEVIKTKGSYMEEFKYFGIKVKGLAEAAENYHVVLAENRKLYNEVQDLKGNIRVYCRIRPFLPGQSQKHSTVEFVGDDGDLVVSNPLKPGKESRKHFKFNKVFGQVSTQEEVFIDTQPLIRSVLDGYNVCIFAYGQTGSGKTYTMSGPSLSSNSDWGVNYRALHDLFHISQTRRSSIIYEVCVQMVEIYNEQIRDLLSSNGSQKRYPFSLFLVNFPIPYTGKSLMHWADFF